ncbi:hypothetical protein BC628DRAFT_917177 [Trametes gibbosa]|nr:hypothetical protein BC628DRAFT_917177 [Trametes gibbosa]
MTTYIPARKDVLMGTADLRDFFDRLATGDYHALAKELNIPTPALQRATVPTPSLHCPTIATVSTTPPCPSPPVELDGDSSIDLDVLDGHAFESTVAGLERAVALLPGLAHGFGAPSSPRARGGAPAPDEADEAFEFTFRLMIHKLYSIRDFAAMVDDVVRTSQARFQPLPPTLLSSRRRSGLYSPSPSSPYSHRFSYSGSHSGELSGLFGGYAGSDGESFVSTDTLASPSEPTLPSSPSLQSVDVLQEHDEDVRALKKRCIGRRMSLAGPEAQDTASVKNAASAGSGGWVYDAAVAAVEAPSYAAFVAGLPPLSPLTESPSRYMFAGAADDQADGATRKRRFSHLAARGF